MARKAQRKSIPLHIRRINVHIEETGSSDPIHSRMILNDFGPKGLGVFCSRSIAPGKEIQITLKDPREIQLKAKVMWCQEQVRTSQIMTEQHFGNRIGVEFIFGSPEDETKIKEFYNEISKIFMPLKLVA
jgi:hypothetical protein